jgi:hypothetical protein
MPPAHEHPDTADVVFDAVLARIALAFAALTFGAPLLLAVFR